MKTIVTHHGAMHADEQYGVAITKLRFGKENVKVIRTRDPKYFEHADIVLDVSYQYDGIKFFDHHQPEKELREEGLPYAACGLMWRAFGREIIASRIDDDEIIDKIFGYVDDNLIMGIDLVDNGVVNECDYPIYGVSDIAGDFNLVWDSEEDEDAAFDKAVDFAYGVLQRMLEEQYAVYRAASLVKEAYQHRENKEILVLPKGCNWTQTLLEIDQQEEVLFVVFPDRHNGYRLMTVPKGGSYEARKSLPESWAGKQDDELSKIVGIDDAIFCHTARFIAGARSLESIMKMAHLAVQTNI